MPVPAKVVQLLLAFEKSKPGSLPVLKKTFKKARTKMSVVLSWQYEARFCHEIQKFKKN